MGRTKALSPARLREAFFLPGLEEKRQDTLGGCDFVNIHAVPVCISIGNDRFVRVLHIITVVCDAQFCAQLFWEAS